jgi:hypothetical protein
VLLDECGVSLGQEASIQGIPHPDRPHLMEVVEQVGIDSDPIVDGIAGSSAGTIELSIVPFSPPSELKPGRGA